MRPALPGPYLDCNSVRSASRSQSSRAWTPDPQHIASSHSFCGKIWYCDRKLQGFFFFLNYWCVSRFCERFVAFFHSIQPSLTVSFDCISSIQKLMISGFWFLAKNLSLGHQMDVAIWYTPQRQLSFNLPKTMLIPSPPPPNSCLP